MKATLILEDDYEKSIVNLALRRLSSAEIQEAIRKLEAGDLKGGESSTLQYETASKIADRLKG